MSRVNMLKILEKLFGRDTKSARKGSYLNLFRLPPSLLMRFFWFRNTFFELLDRSRYRIREVRVKKRIGYFYYDAEKEKVIREIWVSEKGNVLKPRKISDALLDPFVWAVAVRKGYMVQKRTYVAVSKWEKVGSVMLRLYISLRDGRVYYRVRDAFGNIITIPKEEFANLKDIDLKEGKKRYTFEHFLWDVRFNPSILSWSVNRIAKIYGVQWRTAKKWLKKLEELRNGITYIG